MRQSLMQSFDEIYLLDLHGNSLKKEKCPDGSKDENVFDIQQGVAIALFIKRLEKKEKPLHPFSPSPQIGIAFEKEEEEQKPKKHTCKVHHSDVWGNREYKYDWLGSNDIKTTKWKKIKPKSEFYLFIPRDEGLYKVYKNYPIITEIYPINALGIQTHRDNFVVDFDKDVLKRKIQTLRNLSMPDEIIVKTYELSMVIANKKISEVRKELKKDDDWNSHFKEILYRPFDIRDIYFSIYTFHIC